MEGQTLTQGIFTKNNSRLSSKKNRTLSGNDEIAYIYNMIEPTYKLDLCT